MAKNEKTFWDELRRDLKLQCPNAIIQKTADKVFPGIPDIYVADPQVTFWAELKWGGPGPTSESDTKRLLPCTVSPLQKRWLQQHQTVRNVNPSAPRVLVVVGFPEMLYLLHPSSIVEKFPFEYLHSVHMGCVSKGKKFWDIARLLDLIERKF